MRAPPATARLLMLAASLALLVYALVVCAWQCDDAYITFRVVRNALEGHGLTWNPGERVQVFTHPLFMLLALAVHGVMGEVYYAMTFVCAGLAVGVAVGLVAASRERPALAVLLVLVLASSRAFVDFAVSGLENPLLEVLLLVGVSACGAEPYRRRTLLATLALSLAFLTRADAVLLLGPAWLWAVARRRPAVGAMLIGASPAIAWELFSLVYYGSLVPNTALAKLNLELSLASQFTSGVAYLRASLVADPVTLVATLCAVGVALLRGDARARCLALGSILYFGYVLRIGGDFMNGRFLGAPLVLALAAVAIAEREREPQGDRALALAGFGALVYGFLFAGSPLRSGIAYGTDRPMTAYVDAAGVADERAVYYPYTGLLPVLVHHSEAIERGELPMPPFPTSAFGADFARGAERVQVYGQVGFFGYHARGKTVIDLWSLCDPLLARIPYVPDRFHRIGHYPRPLPAGYVESRVQGRNVIHDPGLRSAYDDILRVVSGPVFTRERFAAIRRLATGAHSAAFARARGPAGVPSLATPR